VPARITRVPGKVVWKNIDRTNRVAKESKNHIKALDRPTVEW
jgi:hypothetical protein